MLSNCDENVESLTELVAFSVETKKKLILMVSKQTNKQKTNKQTNNTLFC